MQRNLVITVLAAAALSGGAAILLLRPPAPPPAPPTTWLSSIDPGAVTGLEMTWPDGRGVEIVLRTDVGGLWIMRADESTWPVSAGRVRGTLRLLMDASGAAPAQGLSAAGGVRVEIVTGGTRRTLRIAGTGLAGQSVIECEDGATSTTFVTKGGLAGIFEHAGVMAWREESAFVPVEGEGASRVHVETGGQMVSMVRTGGRWGVLLPVPGPGEAERVAGLLGGLGSLRLRGVSNVNTQSMGFDRAVFAASIELDLRVGKAGGDVERRTLLQELLVGDIADAAGRTRYARVVATIVEPATRGRTPAWTPLPGTVEVASLGEIVADPRVYWARRASMAAPADVAGVRIERREGALDAGADAVVASRDRDVMYQRTLDGWVRSQGGITQAASPSGGEGVAAVVGLLCNEPAQSVSPELPVGTAPLAWIGLRTSGGEPLESVGVGSLAGKDGVSLVVRTGRLFRVYKGAAASRVLVFIGVEVPPEG